MAEEPNPDDLEVADELIAERRSEAPGETPEDMTSWQRPITAAIDIINYRAGQILALLLVPLIAVVVFEVISRNSFSILQNAGFEDLARSLNLGPKLWVYDISRMIAGVLFMAAAGYGLMRGVHIRADFIYRYWSDKTQATVDASLYLLLFIPSMIFFTIVSAQYWWTSFAGSNVSVDKWWEALRVAASAGDEPIGMWEAFKATLTAGETRQADSAWGPLVWPSRLAMPVGAFLLMLQGIPEIFRAFHKMGKARERWFLWLMPIYLIALTLSLIHI